MRADIVPIEELGDSDLGAWRELAGRSLEPNPSLEPDFVLPAARVLNPGGVSVIRVEDDSGWLACLPVTRARRWRRVHVPAALLGWWHIYSLLGTPLLDAGRAPEAAGALIDTARGDRATSMVALDFVTSAGPTTSAIDRALAERRIEPYRAMPSQRAVLHRRESEDYLAVGKKHRREWSRQRRRLGALFEEDVVTVDRSGDPGAVSDFLALEENGWKGHEGTAFASLPGHAEIFTEICAGFHERGRLQLLALEAGSRRLAVKCNLIGGDEILCFKIAFDQELSKYSPGIQLEIDNVHEFHEHTEAALIDSCAAEGNSMINRLWPDRRSLESLLFASAPVRGIIGVSAARSGAWLRARRSK